MSDPETPCSVGFGLDDGVTVAIMRAIDNARRIGPQSQSGEIQNFRLSVPSTHEIMHRQARLCAAAIIQDQCPNFAYEELEQGYKITTR